MESEMMGERVIETCLVTDTRIGPMVVFKEDLWIGKAFIVYGEYAQSETNLIMALSSGICLDIGANIGAFTIPMARKSKHVFAFEPQPAVVNLLLANIAMNRLKNVTVINAAVGERSGKTYIPSIDYNAPNGNIGGVECSKSGEVEVDMVTIDSYNLVGVEFVKIDVEGMEREVLRGMKDTIRRCRPVMLVECDRPGSGDESIKMLREMDYDLYWAATPLYSPQNYRGVKNNIYYARVSIDVLAWPREKPSCNLGLPPVKENDNVSIEFSANRISEIRLSNG